MIVNSIDKMFLKRICISTINQNYRDPESLASKIISK